MCVNCRPLIKAIDAYIQKVDNDLSDELEMQGFLESEKTVEYIQDIEDGVAEVLLEETDYILSEAEKAIDLETFAEDIWPGVKLNDTVKDKLVTIFTENLDKFMPEFVEYYIAQTDKDLTLLQVSKRTTAWVKNWSKDLGDIMKLNSHNEIERILEKGLKDGKGIAAFTREILDSGIRDEYYKARRVAVTEVLRAHSVAQQEAFMQSPAVSEKMWKHTGSYRNDPRENHVKMNGQHVPVNEPFELEGIKKGTHHPMYPRDTSLPPEESINCHCICQPVVDEDILGLSLEERQRLQQEAIDEMDDEWEKELDAENKAKAGIDEEDRTSYEGIPKTWKKLPEGADIAAVNPTGNKENCVNCTIAYEMRSRGYAVVASEPVKNLRNNPFGGWKSPEIKKIDTSDNALAAIKNDMKGWGNGSRAQIAVQWNQKSKASSIWNTEAKLKGHSFIAEQKDGTTIFIDIQTGTEYTDDIFTRFSDNPVEYCRIDNLETNDLGATACKKE